jgi:hypothetical protein
VWALHLSTDDVVPYLLRRGLLHVDAIVRDDYRILQVLGDKPIYRVFSKEAGFVVKQPSRPDEEQTEYVEREAAFLKVAETAPWAKKLKPYLPRLRFYDPKAHILITENISHDTGLAYMRREGARPEVLGKLLGEAFAVLHDCGVETQAPTRLFSTSRPYIFQVDDINIDDMEPPSVRRVFEVIRQERAVTRELARLGKAWECRTLIHRDAKLDNVLIKWGRNPRIWLIDWAVAGLGEPAWDLGATIQSCLTLWLYSIQFRHDEPFTDAATKAAFPWALTKTFIQSLMSAYLKARAGKGAGKREFIERVFRYAGASLLQSEVGAAHAHAQLTARQVAVLQMGSRLVLAPKEAAAEFLEGGQDERFRTAY